MRANRPGGCVAYTLFEPCRQHEQAPKRPSAPCSSAPTAPRRSAPRTCSRASSGEIVLRPARAAAQVLLQNKRLPDSTTLGTASLLPAAPSPQTHSAPLVDTLADLLRDPARSRLAANVFMDALSALLATFLQSKPALGSSSSSGVVGGSGGRVRGNAQHVFIAAATLSVALQWLRVLPHRAQQAPMLRLARTLFELLTVPRPPDDADSARHRGERAGSTGGAAEEQSTAALHLSPLSLFLSGARLFVVFL